MKTGTFTKQPDGTLTGHIRSLQIDIEAELHPLDLGGDNTPAYRVFAASQQSGAQIEIGAAWRKTSQNGSAYLSIELDDPSFAQPAYCRLTEDTNGDGFTLWWDRQKLKSATKDNGL